MSSRERPAPDGGLFHTTQWSVVLNASHDSSPGAREALEQLCRTYWYPLYAFVRRKGNDATEAQDLTQSFFARLLEKKYLAQFDRARGRFRTFLLAALTHFLTDEWDRAQRLKRGGGQTLVSFDAATAEERYRLEPADPADAAKLFERRWAMTLLDRALARLEQEFTDRNQSKLFEALRPFLLGEEGEATLAEAATRIGMTTAAIKMAASRMRGRCRELLREEIRQTAATAQEAEEEYHALQAVLRQ